MRNPTAKERAREAVYARPDIVDKRPMAKVIFNGEVVGEGLTWPQANMAVDALRRGLERLIEDLAPPEHNPAKWRTGRARVPENVG